MQVLGRLLRMLIASVTHLGPHLLESVVSEALSCLAELVVVEDRLGSAGRVPAGLTVAGALLVAAGIALLLVLMIGVIVVIAARSVIVFDPVLLLLSLVTVLGLVQVPIRFHCLKRFLIVVRR